MAITPGSSGGLEVWADQVDLAVAPGEAHDWDLVALGEAGDRLTKGLAHLLEQSRRSDRLVTMLAEKGDHLAANLQGGNVGVEIDAIQALEVKHNMPIENLIDVADRCHEAPPPT